MANWTLDTRLENTFVSISFQLFQEVKIRFDLLYISRYNGKNRWEISFTFSHRWIDSHYLDDDKKKKKIEDLGVES